MNTMKDLHENLKALIDELKQCDAKKVMVQLPEGLKISAAAIADDLRQSGIEAIIAADATYGACDVKDKEAKSMGCDLLVHIGHNKFYVDFPTNVPVLYYPWSFDVDLKDIDFSAIKETKIGLITNIQHMKLLGQVSDLVKRAGKEPVIGGQVLGCWYVNAEKIEDKIDCFLFIGSGVFHSLGLRTEKPVYALDLERIKIDHVDMSILEKRRYAHIFSARNAQSFAILVTSKSGQHQLIGNAERIAKYIESKDKKAFIVLMDEIRNDKLTGIKADAFINTACPRLIDDTWTKPFVNTGDVEKIFEL